MKNDLAKWVEEEGVRFSKKIGIRKGYTVLDFGCGRGYYIIPMAKVVGNIGMVYALDKNKSALSELKKIIAKEDIKNVELINDINDVSLGDKSVDVVLCYDVLHYMKFSDRKVIYKDVRRILRAKALFSVYPKHSKENLPSGELADVSVGEIVREIENSGFVFIGKIKSKLLHDGCFEEGCILNFRKGE
jgi:ubiquinone/menaquinone biosynthesis C-methylase UbiE